MVMTDEPRGWKSYSISVAVSVLAAMAMLVGSLPLVPLVIKASPQDAPPPGSRTGYIRNLESPSRQEWQKPDQVVERLQLKSGQRVAEIGSGSGYFVVRFARAVGETGKVYAADIDSDMLNYLKWRAGKEELANIELVEATPDDPKLAGSSVDLVFLCNTIHHIENRDRYYPYITRALREGGRLVVVDFYNRPLPVPSPRVKIARSDMIKEIEQAGFHLVEEYDFLPHQYFLVFELN